MISIIVGIPGAGKTLYAVSELAEEYKKADRQVYYYNIPNLNKQALGWIELDDPTTWHTLPTGSVIIIDEAHEIFKKRDFKEKTPEHIEMAATLRHRGHDLVLLTQHPVGIDKFLRDRCGRFVYLRAPLTRGSHAFKYEWPEYNEKYRDQKEWRTADEETWSHRTDAFGLYSSAEIHTKKKFIPKSAKRIFVVACIALVFGGFIFTKLYDRWYGSIDLEQANIDQQAGLDSAVENITDTIEDYFHRFNSRIPGLPHTASEYDSLTAAKSYPRYNCISDKQRCWCYTQQMSRVDMSEQLCRKIVQRGYFDSAREET